MSDRPDTSDQPRDADELTEAVSDLGSDDEQRLEAVAERNESLEQRLPTDDDLPRTKQAREEG